MRVCLDIGNTQTHIGLYNESTLIWDLRLNTNDSLENLILEVKSAFKTRGILLNNIISIGVSSVVPDLNKNLENLCIKHFEINPCFIDAMNATLIDFTKYPKPSEIGSDLVASAVAVVNHSPLSNSFVIDIGTATTISAINDKSQFLGGVILAGINMQLQALTSLTAQLGTYNIIKPKNFLGRTTQQAIQSGIYYGHLGAINFLINNLGNEVFANQDYQIIATGGLSHLYKNHEMYTLILPNLVLDGILQVLITNKL